MAIAWQSLHSKSAVPTTQTPKYVSLGGGYLFSVPAKYTVDETIIPGVAVAYPEASPPQSGQTLVQLYDNGTVAVQPITALKDNNAKAFKEYVNGTLASELRKSTHAASDVREAKQGNIQGFRVFAISNDGKRLRAIYAVDFTQPAIMVAKDENDAMKVIGSTIEDLKKTKIKSDIDQVAQATKEIVGMIQNQDVDSVRKRSTDVFNKNETKKDLAAKLKGDTVYLNGSITIVGGSYDGKSFVTQLIFAPKVGEPATGRGTVSLKKQGDRWKLDSLELPK